MRIMPFMKRKKGVQFAGTGLDTGGGVTDYDDLLNKPQIGGVTLTGNKTLADLGVQSVLTFDTIPTADSSNPVTSGGVASALSSNLKIQSLADLNDADGTRVMFLSAHSATANSPGVGYWTVISMPYGDARIRQIAIGSADTLTPEVKVRVSAYTSSGPNWGDWKTIAIS